MREALIFFKTQEVFKMKTEAVFTKAETNINEMSIMLKIPGMLKKY